MPNFTIYNLGIDNIDETTCDCKTYMVYDVVYVIYIRVTNILDEDVIIWTDD